MKKLLAIFIASLVFVACEKEEPITLLNSYVVECDCNYTVTLSKGRKYQAQGKWTLQEELLETDSVYLKAINTDTVSSIITASALRADGYYRTESEVDSVEVYYFTRD